jgi:hypothetical protein
MQNIFLIIFLKTLRKYLTIIPPTIITMIRAKILEKWVGTDKFIKPKNFPIRHATFATITLYNIDLTKSLVLP